MQKRLLKYLYAATAVFAALLLSPPGLLRPAHADDEEQRLLSMILNKFSPRSGFTVVSPYSTLGRWLNAPGSSQVVKKSLADALHRADPAVDALVDQLVARNRIHHRLGLHPSPAEAFVVDDGRFSKYLIAPGGWKRLYAEHPDVRGMTELSLPAYDPDNGLALVYVGKRGGENEGSGGLILFRYAATRIVILGTVPLWGT